MLYDLEQKVMSWVQTRNFHWHLWRFLPFGFVWNNVPFFLLGKTSAYLHGFFPLWNCSQGWQCADASHACARARIILNWFLIPDLSLGLLKTVEYFSLCPWNWWVEIIDRNITLFFLRQISFVVDNKSSQNSPIFKEVFFVFLGSNEKSRKPEE